MKVRIGVGASSVPVGDLPDFAAETRGLGFDSLWISDTLTRPGPDPLVSMSWAAAANPGLKVGTTMVLPGRNPIRLAKELATLDELSGGNLLVTFVAGLPRSPEREAIGVPVRARLRAMEELLGILRELHAGNPVSYEGPGGWVENATVVPLPRQQPLEFWLGGASPAALALCGRAGDGWLPALCPAKEAAAGKAAIEEAAAAAGRTISSEHFGVSIPFSSVPLDEATRRNLQSRARRDDASALVPIGAPGVRRCLEEFLEVGFSKFVLRPIAGGTSWRSELEFLAEAACDLQS